MATPPDHSSSGQNPPRLSRYRSVRQARPQAPQDVVPPVPQVPSASPLSSTRQKSMSRYHSKSVSRPSVSVSRESPRTASNSSSSIKVETPQSRPDQHAFSQSPPPPPPAANARPLAYDQYHGQSPMRPRTANQTSPISPAAPRQRRVTASSTHHDAARALLDYEAERQNRMRQAQEAEREARRMKDEEARQRQLEAQKKIEDDIRKKKEAEDRERKRKLWEKEEAKRVAEDEKREAELWAQKKKKKEKPPTPKSPVRDGNIVASDMGDKISFFKKWRVDDTEPQRPKTGSREAARPKTSSGEEPKPTIRPGGGGIVPQIDAPVSAVNHGDRRVRVVCRDSSILLAVTPTTTPLQLIRSSGTFFEFPIDTRNSVLQENFSKSSLRRHLRMYEHVRDVLNSWDSDDQHQLILEPYDRDLDTRLYSTSAPKVKPQGGSWWMYFSQKPGKWEKRFIQLNHEGQITAAKNESGKDVTNICNISDFEVFSLSKEGERKKFKPPKKHCYAVKSMQKSSMFLGNTGFMHLFCCSDATQGQNFQDAVFRWRTWYLVNILGVGATGPPDVGGSNGALITEAGSHHKRQGSEASQYVLGSFNTSLGFDVSDFNLSYEDKLKPPISAINRSTSTRKSSGTQVQRNLSVRNPPRPSMDGPRPLILPAAAGNFPGFKPLIDLTPQYQAPPQHLNKGKGFKPAVISEAGLVDSATGPELLPGAIVIPESREWRGKGTVAPKPPQPSGGDMTRSGTVKGGRGLMGDLDLNKGFTGGGLLGPRLNDATGN
jgi:hypothetical protein